MARVYLIVSLSAGLLAGCGDGLAEVGDAAEKARIRTERIVDSAEAASNTRQARIFAEAAQMHQEETVREEGARYEARKDGAGDNWIIYDNRTGSPAMLGTEVQTGLSRAEAAARLQHMEDEDKIVFRK